MDALPKLQVSEEISHEEDHHKRCFIVSSCCGGSADIQVQEVHQETTEKTTQVAKDCCVIL
jgi:hypothetical protein